MKIHRGTNQYQHNGSGSIPRLVSDRALETISVKDFGATGDGSTDDTVAIQAAIDSITATGGCVRFPPGRYKIMSTITVSSLHPIRLIGDMFGSISDTTATTSGILIGQTIAGPMIQFTAPDPGARGETGGGSVEGLVFYENTPTGRTFTCTAVLDLNDFPLSRVHNCVFQHIAGRAILGGFLVQSEISNNVIRYCGDTGKPAIDLVNGDSVHVAQSLQILGNRIEVIYDAEYIKIASVPVDISVIDNRFEADTAVAATNGKFIDSAAFYCRIIGNNFNRNTGNQVTISGAGNVINGNIWRTGAYSTTALTISGGRNLVVANSFESTRTGYEIEAVGPCTITGNNFYFCGAIRIPSGSVGVTISNNTFLQLTCTSAVLGNNFWIDTVASQNNVISGNILNNAGGSVTDVGGIRVAAALNVVIGNAVKGFTGSGDGAIGIRVESPTAVVVGNSTEDAPITSSTIRAIFEGNDTTGTLPNETTATYDPPNLADGAFVTTVVSWTGIAAGDIVDVQFAGLTAGFHLQAISGTNQVSVTFFNETGGAVDLPSGTLKLRLRRR